MERLVLLVLLPFPLPSLMAPTSFVVECSRQADDGVADVLTAVVDDADSAAGDRFEVNLGCRGSNGKDDHVDVCDDEANDDGVTILEDDEDVVVAVVNELTTPHNVIDAASRPIHVMIIIDGVIACISATKCSDAVGRETSSKGKSSVTREKVNRK
jgi:hypothetical protein